MNKVYVSLVVIALGFLLLGCQSATEEKMILLDEDVSEINLSLSNGAGEMNDKVILKVNDKKDIETFEQAILTAVKQATTLNESKPDYDVMVEYKSNEGKLPTHAIHLWLGKKNEPSVFSYMMSEDTYITSPEMTKKLRGIILK